MRLDAVTSLRPLAGVLSAYRHWIGSIFVVMVVWVPVITPDGATCRADDRQVLSELRDDLKQAGRLYAEGKYRESAKLVRQVQRKYETLDPRPSAELKGQRQAILRSLQKARGLLRRQGISLPAMTTPNLVRPPNPANETKGDEMKVASDQPISFARHIAPIVSDHCLGCHGQTNPRSDLSLATFARMSRGGDSGPLWDGQQPESSLLIQKLKGTASGERMPLNRPPLSDQQIAMISKWIQAGAKFDGESPEQSTRDLALVTQIKTASSDELSVERKRLAQKAWELSFPDRPLELVETDTLLVIGASSEEELREDLQQAVRIRAKIIRTLKLPATAPALKGRLTVFVIASQYDFSEFVQMAEQRSLPVHSSGHWRTPGLDAYVVLRRSKDEDEHASNVCRCLAGAIFELQGEFPEWFVKGAGVSLAHRIVPRSPQIRSMRQQLPEVMAAMDRPNQFIKQQMTPESATVASADFVGFLMKNSRGFSRLVQVVGRGQTFEEAVKEGFGKQTDELLDRWWRSKRKG